MRVAVKYVGESYSGEYIANHVIHEFSVYGGYTTTVYLKRNMAGGEMSSGNESYYGGPDYFSEQWTRRHKILL